MQFEILKLSVGSPSVLLFSRWFILPVCLFIPDNKHAKQKALQKKIKIKN